MYDLMFGHATANFGHSILISKNVALPYLKISSDEDGFLYVESPIFTEDKNGVIGIGRTISKKEIEHTNQVIAAREKQFKDALQEFSVPDQFSTGNKLDHIGGDGIRTKLAEYFNQDSPIMLFYEYCNCTKSKLFGDEITKANSQILDVNGILVLAHPKAPNYITDIHDKYVFEFYYDGYRISFHTDQKLESDLMLVKELLEFKKQHMKR